MAGPLRQRTLDDTARVALIERGILVLVIGGLFIGVSVTVNPLITDSVRRSTGRWYRHGEGRHRSSL